MSAEIHRLPIYDIRDRLLSSLSAGNRVVVEAPTGSGKSTQVPQMLLDSGIAGDGQIVVLQPRRIAARMLARRVAVERSARLGEEVGYQVRLERHAGHATRIKYETDGIILRELTGDPELRHVAVIVFDEFHERHLYSDLMMGFALRLQQAPRPDLKIVVMSATLDTSLVMDFLAPCEVITGSGRAYPVEVRYIDQARRIAKTPIWELAAAETGSLLRDQPEGDLLVFMPGAYEIRRTIEALSRVPAAKSCDILPLYGELPPDQQDRAVMPSSSRKVIVATNVAETSLTIEGITGVVDSGLARKANFDPRRGFNTLLVEPISRASADQRAGRAGRLRPGVCVRLWTERSHLRRESHEAPEIHRVDPSETILQLKALGIVDIDTFQWVQPPRADATSRATRLLQELGALDSDGSLTPLGRKLAAFPLHPRISRMLIAGEFYGCLPTAALLAAMLQERSILLRRPSRAVQERRLDLIEDRTDSDLLLMTMAWRAASRHAFDRGFCDELGVHAGTARTVGRLQRQLLAIAEGQGLDSYEHNPPPEAYHRCVLAGFPDQVACRLGEGTPRCSMVHGRRGTITDDSVLAREHRLFVATDVQEISAGSRVDVKLAGLAAIETGWLAELFGEAFSEHREVLFDTVGKRVRAEARTAYRDLVIAVERLTDITDDEAAAVIAREVLDGRLKLKKWDAKVDQWIARVNVVAAHCPEFGVPAIADDDRPALIEQICHGAKSSRDLKTREIWPVLRQWLSAEQRAAVEAYAPERVELENGRSTRVRYDEETGGPYIAMRVQELYDVNAVPTICNGRLALRVHILAPNMRPVQITDDLAGFWTNTYAQVRKDLRGRYPKHEWR